VARPPFPRIEWRHEAKPHCRAGCERDAAVSVPKKAGVVSNTNGIPWGSKPRRAVLRLRTRKWRWRHYLAAGRRKIATSFDELIEAIPCGLRLADSQVLCLTPLGVVVIVMRQAKERQVIFSEV